MAYPILSLSLSHDKKREQNKRKEKGKEEEEEEEKRKEEQKGKKKGKGGGGGRGEKWSGGPLWGHTRRLSYKDVSLRSHACESFNIIFIHTDWRSGAFVVTGCNHPTCDGRPL